tara:strand:- start:4421 stop:4642 length:222 start_codon:yes stop_codon:yes gene_type:complete
MMINTIIFIGAALCIETEGKMICQNQTMPKNNTTFQRTVTDWQKITSETIYNDNKEVKIETQNISPRYECPFN